MTPRAPRILAPLRHRSFRLLAAGQATSNVGDACYAVALPWFVLSAHGGTTLLGVVIAAYGVPRTVLIMAGGWAADRWGPRTVMLGADSLRALAVAALAVAASAGPANPALLIPVAIVLGTGEGLFLPASFSVVPALLPAQDLQAGNALAFSLAQLAALAGPAAGGALVALGGPGAAFWADAASFAVSAATLLAMRQPAPGANPAPGTGEAPEEGQDGEPAAPASRLWDLVRTERVIPVLLAVTVAANLGSAGLDGVALPALAHGPLHAGAQGYGAVLAAFGAGSLAGTLVAGQAAMPRRPAIAATAAFTAGAAAIAVTPFLGTVALVAAVQVLVGGCTAYGNTCTVTAFQRWAPPGALGRLGGLVMLASYGMTPVSVLLAAWFGHVLGLASFFVFAAVMIAAAVLGGLTQPAWRDFGVPEPAPQQETAPAAGP